ncbi:MAG: Rnf-Nqr domain containing protein [Desulfitobacteriaceae bacterium]|nr:Rnf-Nqr domain containing protein [Desulfitobacteriaceae bacterium]MDD4345978.1 Rnf-Nqr domain containing protein [Desulfitobacteriaceae bacterium]MDD4401009.1 Rnf-Nqr domain containing protein [Desulfitobacteriaceae bacterium]
MKEYLLLFASTVLVNNFILSRFLGLCIFFGVSKNVNAAAGMGIAVTGVMTLTSMCVWAVYNLILVPLNLTFISLVIIVLFMAIFVQLLEMIIRKFAPALYQMWGIYLLIVATNCVILGVPLINIEANYSFAFSTVHAFGAGVGFALALVLMASLREKIRFADVPKPLEGLGIAFILAGCLSLAFFGFSGMISI